MLSLIISYFVLCFYSIPVVQGSPVDIPVKNHQPVLFVNAQELDIRSNNYSNDTSMAVLHQLNDTLLTLNFTAFGHHFQIEAIRESWKNLNQKTAFFGKNRQLQKSELGNTVWYKGRLMDDPHSIVRGYMYKDVFEGYIISNRLGLYYLLRHVDNVNADILSNATLKKKHFNAVLVSTTKNGLKSFSKRANEKESNITEEVKESSFRTFHGSRREAGLTKMTSKYKRAEKDVDYKVCELEILLSEEFMASEESHADVYEKLFSALKKANDILSNRSNELKKDGRYFGIAVQNLRILNASERELYLKLPAEKLPRSMLWQKCLTLVFVVRDGISYENLGRNYVPKHFYNGKILDHDAVQIIPCCNTGWNLSTDYTYKKVNWLIVDTSYTFKNEKYHAANATELSLYISRAILFSFGVSFDDKNNGTCMFEEYLMSSVFQINGTKLSHFRVSNCTRYGFANNGTKDNSLSSCHDKLPVVKETLARGCGNGLTDENEECDCGTKDTCEAVDPCCVPHGTKEEGKTPCTIPKKDKECTPLKHVCCSAECKRYNIEDMHACAKKHSTVGNNTCELWGYCDGLDFDTCPERPRKGRLCNNGYRVCSENSTCTESVCRYVNYEDEECTCPESVLGSKVNEQCQVCCSNKTANQTCVPMHWNFPSHLPRPRPGPGTNCTLESNTPGICDKEGKCIDPTVVSTSSTTVPSTKKPDTPRTTVRLKGTSSGTSQSEDSTRLTPTPLTAHRPQCPRLTVPTIAVLCYLFNVAE